MSVVGDADTSQAWTGVTLFPNLLAAERTVKPRVALRQVPSGGAECPGRTVYVDLAPGVMRPVL